MYLVAMAAAEMTLTKFLRQSGPALEQVERVDLRLRRRDGEDLYLKRADREEAEHASLAAAGRMLARMLQTAEGDAILMNVIEDAVPWSHFLSENDRRTFATEFVRSIQACAEFDNFAPVGVLLTQWKNTAEARANPALRAALEADLDDGSVVERPATAA